MRMKNHAFSFMSIHIVLLNSSLHRDKKSILKNDYLSCLQHAHCYSPKWNMVVHSEARLLQPWSSVERKKMLFFERLPIGYSFTN